MINFNFIRYPRPETPPVVKLEQRYLTEYGFPSTHTMAVTNISYTLIRLMSSHRQQFAHNSPLLTLVLTVALASIALVSLSRVYLGMHSYLDVTGGCLASLLISHAFLNYSHLVATLIEHSLLTGCSLSLCLLLVCLFYPNKVSN